MTPILAAIATTVGGALLDNVIPQKISQKLQNISDTFSNILKTKEAVTSASKFSPTEFIKDANIQNLTDLENTEKHLQGHFQSVLNNEYGINLSECLLKKNPDHSFTITTSNGSEFTLSADSESCNTAHKLTALNRLKQAYEGRLNNISNTHLSRSGDGGGLWKIKFETHH